MPKRKYGLNMDHFEEEEDEEWTSSEQDEEDEDEHEDKIAKNKKGGDEEENIPLDSMIGSDPLLHCEQKKEKKRPRISYQFREIIPEQYQEEWYHLQEYMYNEEPTLEKILSAKVEKREKSRLVRLYHRFKNTETQDEEDTTRKEINEILSKQSSEEYIKDQDKYHDLETRLMDVGKRSGNLKVRLLDLPIPEMEKSLLYQRYLRLEQCSPLDSEKGKLTEWLYYAVQIPRSLHPVFEDMVQKKQYYDILSRAKGAMDQKLFGMERAKEQILVTFFDMLVHPNTSGHSIGLVGGAGVGKTQLARTLAEALSLPFQQISLGGINDVSFLDGSSLVFEGSQPGILVKKLIKMGYKNGILFFDELDKIAGTEHGKEVSNSLLHITDFSQNNKFNDKYLGELDIDLSHLFFVFSMNDETLLDPILKDRIPLIRVPGYSLTDKVNIVQNYLLPNELQSRGLDEKEIILPDKVIQYMISKHHLEKQEGIRELQDIVSELVKKINLHKMYQQSLAFSSSSSSSLSSSHHHHKKRKTESSSSSSSSSYPPISFSFSCSTLTFPVIMTSSLVDTFLPVKNDL